MAILTGTASDGGGMGKHTLREESTTGSHKVVSTATAIVLSTGLMVAIEDSLDVIPVYPSDTQPMPIIPTNYAEAATHYGKSVSAMQQLTPPITTTTPPTTITPPVVVPADTPITTTKTTPKPSPSPRPKVQAVDTSIIGIAKSWLGKNIPYLFGGATLKGMDCSHFVWEVLKQAGYNVPYRNSYALKDWTIPVSRANALPGDLVFRPGHVGIYAGNNQVIDHGSGYGPKLHAVWEDVTPTFGRIP